LELTSFYPKNVRNLYSQDLSHSNYFDSVLHRKITPQKSLLSPFYFCGGNHDRLLLRGTLHLQTPPGLAVNEDLK
jgi:hypothetical protein